MSKVLKCLLTGSMCGTPPQQRSAVTETYLTDIVITSFIHPDIGYGNVFMSMAISSFTAFADFISQSQNITFPAVSFRSTICPIFVILDDSISGENEEFLIGFTLPSLTQRGLNDVACITIIDDGKIIFFSRVNVALGDSNTITRQVLVIQG